VLCAILGAFVVKNQNKGVQRERPKKRRRARVLGGKFLLQKLKMPFRDFTHFRDCYFCLYHRLLRIDILITKFIGLIISYKKFYTMQMKQSILSFLFALGLALPSMAQQKIGNNPTTMQPSAAMELESTTKGFLPPRMSTTERDAISSPAQGLVVYNTNTKCLEWYILSGWYNACEGSLSGLVNPSACDNDVSVGSGKLVSMLYDYDGNGTAEYTWCAREVTAAGYTWLDRNLGAYKVADSSKDTASYGDLYQWGRAMDGHHKRYQRAFDVAEGGIGGTGIGSGQKGERANDIWNDAGVITVTPNDLRFIEGDDLPTTQNNDWHDNNPNSVRWDANGGTNKGINDPCPSGYRVPTSTELQDLDNTFSPNTAVGAFSSPLKLPVSGLRSYITGGLGDISTWGDYWSSTVNGTFSYSIQFGTTSSIISRNRAYGFTVRCIKD